MPEVSDVTIAHSGEITDAVGGLSGQLAPFDNAHAD